MLCADAVAQLSTTLDEFATRFHHWCRQEIVREIDRDFPVVRSLPCSAAFLFLDFAAESSYQEIRDLMTGGIKRFNPRGATLAEDPVTEDESSVRRKFLAYSHPEVVLAGQAMTSLRVSPRALAIRETERLGQSTTKFAKKILKKELQEALRPALGEPDRSRGGLQYCKSVGSWYLFTSLDLSGQMQLNLGQWIAARRRIDFCPTRLLPAITPLSWLGVHPDTGFDLIREHEVQGVATTVSALCSHVSQHVPALLSGLSHQIPEDVDDSAYSPLAQMRKRKVVEGGADDSCD
jgi:hypothetical protein